MAEGAGALVLESLEHARARGARILGVLAGCGEQADVFHRTRSSPDGHAIIGAMHNALDASGLSPADIGYINAHGTGTPENDKMEALGVTAVFGARAREVPISSNKSMIGHTLSAAGAVEAVFTLQTLHHQRLPATINRVEADPTIDLDVVPNVARDAVVRHAMSNSFGFGGQNACLVFSQEPALRKSGGRMRALQLVADRDLRLIDMAEPPAPAAGEVQIRTRSVALNHIDVWGWRGMAFAQRKLPLVVGAEASAEVLAAGGGVEGFVPGQLVVPYGALTCGHCKPCREGRDNLCENVGGVMGFHLDGFARERLNIPARLLIPVPEGVSAEDACCAPITFGTVQHMLFDNAKLQPGESILVQAGGSGIGTIAIRLAKAIGCTVYTTVGSDEKMPAVLALGADHAINYSSDRFEGRIRRLTGKRGVDVVFEHVGASTWEGSLFSLKPGGRLVTCGSTSGVTAQTKPDDAVPAAASHHRLVRMHDGECAGGVGVDGTGRPACDRYGRGFGRGGRGGWSGWRGGGLLGRFW